MFRTATSCGVLLLAGLAIASCDNGSPTTLPAVKAPPGVKGPTKEEVMAKQIEEAKVDPSDFDPIPNLGQATAYKTPDGEVWQRYANGIMIQQLKQGKGAPAQPGQKVTLAYRGTFPNGQQFDASPKDEPLSFVLAKKHTVIKGWSIVVATMKPGSKIKAFIPPDLAYGPGGQIGKIPANAPLIFEMELISATGEPVVVPAEPTVDLSVPGLEALKNPKPLGPDLPAATAPKK